MRGVQATYRITNSTTTTLAQPLSATDDIVYVRSVDGLSVPDGDRNVWGIMVINGERILYRNIDFNNNTVSSLLRGTAGTAISAHSTGSAVYNLSRVNLVPEQYQDRLVTSIYIADGAETEFSTDIDLSEYTIDYANKVVEVYIGGSRQLNNYFIPELDPVVVIFDEPPPAGQEVVIFARQGLSWYQPGSFTASDGVPLQETNTVAARFFKGLD
jgi:hypothetical protein